MKPHPSNTNYIHTLSNSLNIPHQNPTQFTYAPIETTHPISQIYPQILALFTSHTLGGATHQPTSREKSCAVHNYRDSYCIM